MGFDDVQMLEIERTIVATPDAHPVLRGLRGVRKARFARLGGGKSGGGRVIYYVALSPDLLFMMTAYPKNERDDLSPEQRRAILAVIESIKGGRQ